MRHDFLQGPESYRPNQHVTTPYMRAQAEWDSRIGTSTAQAKNWRIAFFLSVLLTSGLLVVNGIQVMQRKLVPVVVTVNPETGIPNVLGRVGEGKYEPQDEEIKYFLGQFLQKVRAVPADPVLIKRNWLEAYKFLRRSAAATLNAMTNNDDTSPLKKIGEETVTIQPISVIRVGSSPSYQARWTETVYGKNGGVKEEYTMAGVFTIEIGTPTDEPSIMVNPLGIFISTFQWAKEL